jgi:hypothetical protein
MRRSTKRKAGASLAGAVGLGALLAGCSDIYYDRRETVLFGADDAVAANIAVQTVDPWPRYSADRHIPGNGQRVETAIERYRTGRVIAPQGTGTASSYQQQQQQQQQQQASQAMQSGTGAGTVAAGGGIPTQ